MRVSPQSKPRLPLYAQLCGDFAFSSPLNVFSEVFSSFPLNVSPITKGLWGGPEDSTQKNASEREAGCQIHPLQGNCPTSPFACSAFAVLCVSLAHKPTGRTRVSRVYSASSTLQMLKRCLSLELCSEVKLFIVIQEKNDPFLVKIICSFMSKGDKCFYSKY